MRTADRARFVWPYQKGDTWYRGTVHVHTSNSPCGHYPTEVVCAIYGDSIVGYDFIAITDHMVTTRNNSVHDSLLVFDGQEFKRSQRQILGIDIGDIDDDPDDLTNHQAVIDEINRQNGLAIICHPHIYNDSYWSVEELVGLHGYSGLEIYNHNVRMNNAGRANATDCWDSLLTAGVRVWGYANDDMHHASRIGGGFLMVQATERSKPAIKRALRDGAFFPSTGAFFTELYCEDDILRCSLDVHTAKDCEVLLIGNDAVVLDQFCDCKDVVIPLEQYLSANTYLRIQVLRGDGSYAWSQPLFNIEGNT